MNFFDFFVDTSGIEITIFSGVLIIGGVLALAFIPGRALKMFIGIGLMAAGALLYAGVI